MFLKPAKTVCNNYLIHAVLLQAVEKFIHINMPILAFVGNNPDMCDDFIMQHISRRDIPFYIANVAEERWMETLVRVGTIPPIPKYMMFINEWEWFQTFKSQDEMVGCLAHELAHIELWGNTDIVIPISRRLADRVEASKSSTRHFHTNDPYNMERLSSNEHATDALAIGRGFGRELSACIKALQRVGQESERCGIPCQEIDEALYARDLVNYRIARKKEVLRGWR